MKKIIQKPENWQDFESLCKKLWGEIWEIPTKIKKNGRNGQAQAGVDIYGVPKGEINYWGIQCKGKDDYANAKLSKDEIDREINKAKLFSPKLDVFIIATTMNKDADIEAYVREKDIASRGNNEFEILLFCWEDIADLIDENQDTYNFWVASKQHKAKFGIEVHLNDFKPEFTIRPTCVRKIKRYRLKKEKPISGFVREKMYPYFPIFPIEKWSFFNGRINEAMCSFEIIIENIGAVVIEDWKMIFTIAGDYKKITDTVGTGPMGMIDIGAIKQKTTLIDGKQIYYFPKDNHPLIQKDNRYFKAYIIPEYKEYSIPIEWELLARDFSSKGTLMLNVIPKYKTEIIYEDVDSEDELKEDEVLSITAKKNYKDEEDEGYESPSTDFDIFFRS